MERGAPDVNSLPIRKVDDCMESIQFPRFPAVCVLCGETCGTDMDLCGACRSDFPSSPLRCRGCGIPLPAPGACGRCLQTPPPHHGVFCLFDYAPPLDGLITGLKYHGRLAHALLLGGLMARRLLGEGGDRPEAIIPVPLHGKRLRERGFNQAVEIARPVARALRLPLDPRSCRRRRATSPQSMLPAAQRSSNVRDAFAVKGAMRWRHVAIVDDVMTTGHTVDALSRCLLRHGVEKIQVWVCARAAPPAD